MRLKFQGFIFLEGGWTYSQQIHVSFQVRMQWGISGLKSKWRRLMKHFDSTKEKYSHLFITIALLTNFLHKHYQDFTIEVICEHHNDLAKHGWDGDY